MDDQEVSTSCALVPPFHLISPDFFQKLPDLDFPVNTMAEGRVLVPWEHQKNANLTVQYTAGSSFILDPAPFEPLIDLEDRNKCSATEYFIHPRLEGKR